MHEQEIDLCTSNFLSNRPIVHFISAVPCNSTAYFAMYNTPAIMRFISAVLCNYTAYFAMHSTPAIMRDRPQNLTTNNGQNLQSMQRLCRLQSWVSVVHTAYLCLLCYFFLDDYWDDPLWPHVKAGMSHETSWSVMEKVVNKWIMC